MTEKACRHCGIQKPYTKEFFSKGKTKRENGQWLSVTCLDCYGRRKAAPQGHKMCASCLKVLPTEAFSAIKRGGCHSRCKICEVERMRKARVLEPKEMVRQRSASYKSRNQEKVREYARKYRREKLITNPEFVTAERARTAEKKRRWPEKYKAYKANRTAREVEAGGRLTGDEVRGAFERSGGQCVYCDIPLLLTDREGWHLEHLVPLSRGGDNAASNVAAACSRCNLQKGSKTAHEFMPDRFSPPEPQAAD